MLVVGEIRISTVLPVILFLQGLTQFTCWKFPWQFFSGSTCCSSKKSGKMFAFWCKKLFSLQIAGCLCSEVIFSTIAVIALYWQCLVSGQQAESQTTSCIFVFYSSRLQEALPRSWVSSLQEERPGWASPCQRASLTATKHPWQQAAAKNGWPLEPPRMPWAWCTAVLTNGSLGAMKTVQSSELDQICGF